MQAGHAGHLERNILQFQEAFPQDQTNHLSRQSLFQVRVESQGVQGHAGFHILLEGLLSFGEPGQQGCLLGQSSLPCLGGLIGGSVMNMRLKSILEALMSGAAFPEVLQPFSHKHPVLTVQDSWALQPAVLCETLGRQVLQVPRRQHSRECIPGLGWEEAVRRLASTYCVGWRSRRGRCVARSCFPFATVSS